MKLALNIAVAATLLAVIHGAAALDFSKTPAPAAVSFMHYTASGQGLIRLFVPASRLQTDEAAIAWANQLPATFRSFFQGRNSEVGLPPLP